jgi:hypothetical protein
MKRPGVLLAAALVLAANAVILAKVAYNRSGTPTAAIELTEYELRLMRPQRESTFLYLRLQWHPLASRFRFEDGPGWFNQAKLQDLGYDCRFPLADPAAPEHYRAMQAKQVLAVLEYKPGMPPVEQDEAAALSHLEAVDAGLDFDALRQKYPSQGRFLIVPATVRLFFEQRWNPDTRSWLAGAFLQGRIMELLPGEISVPHSQRQIFEALSELSDPYFSTPAGRARGPRYAAVLNYGRNHEPWIGACRRLPPQP